MNTETPFEELDDDKQNKLLRKIAVLLRPMLGEIGEVLVKKTGLYGTELQKKPGFVGLLFEHPPDERGILFAEYVDQDTRIEVRNKETEKQKNEVNHIFERNNNYLKVLRKAAKDQVIRERSLGSTGDIKLKKMNKDIKNAFKGYYGNYANDDDFEIKLLVRTLRAEKSKEFYAALYFAFERNDAISGIENIVESLDRLVEQLLRNALGLAAISDHELRSATSYLSAKLPQRFDDYVIPQTLAAIYAYVREVVPITLGDTAPQKPDVTWEDEDEKKKLESVHKASKINVNRRVGGSLKGAQVFSLTITTASKGGESTTYPAVAKFSTVKEARDEADGLRKMQRYYSRIGKMLPPPLEVYLLTKEEKIGGVSRRIPVIDKDGDWLDTSCISVTPDLEGSILAEKIAASWGLPTRRVERFTGCLEQARTFIREIQRQPFILSDEGGAALSAETHQPHDLLIEFFKKELKSPAQKNRYSQLLAVFSSKFPQSPSLELEKIKAKLVNPLMWIEKMIDSPDSIVWQRHHQRPKRVVLKHGDFHTGNLFYTAEGDNLVVLDYDRVGGGLPEEDLACLDASFVSVVFGLSDFDLPENWEEFAPDSIALLSWKHSSNIRCLNTNPFARDILETLSILRPSTVCPFYAASVVKALVGQLRARCVPWNHQQSKYELVDAATLNKLRGRNAAAWLYMAMMLTHLVISDSSDLKIFNPFAVSSFRPDEE